MQKDCLSRKMPTRISSGLSTLIDYIPQSHEVSLQLFAHDDVAVHYGETRPITNPRRINSKTNLTPTVTVLFIVAVYAVRTAVTFPFNRNTLAVSTGKLICLALRRSSCNGKTKLRLLYQSVNRICNM